jgi:hypothetical protein
MTDAVDADAATALAEFRGTPEQATAALSAKAAAYKASTTPAPTTPSAAARVELDRLSRDAGFQSKRNSGDPEARRTFSDLCAAAAAGDPATDALAGGPELPADTVETTVNGEPSSRALRREAEGLLSQGFGPEVVKQMINGSPVSAAEKEAAVRLRAMRLGDPAYVRAYLGGSAAERYEMGLLAAVISSEVAA